MNELVPVVLGVLIGVGAGRASSRWALAAVHLLAAGAGVFWSIVTGELAEGWLYAVVDASVVMASTAASRSVLRRLVRRNLGKAF